MVEILYHGLRNLVLWVHLESLLQILVRDVHHAQLHASARTIYVVLRIACKEVNGSREFDVGSLVVLLVKALGS